MFTSILRLVRGSPTTLQKIRLVLRGTKREKKRGKGQTTGGKNCSSTLVLRGLTTMGKYNVRATLLRSLLPTLVEPTKDSTICSLLPYREPTN
jgi:hypothetical protein